MGLKQASMNPLAPLLSWIDLFGIAVFAASGALAAAQRRQTIVTFAFFALVTGVGGGTVRDLLIDAPVFWVRDWRVAAVCLGTALLIWVTPQRWSRTVPPPTPVTSAKKAKVTMVCRRCAAASAGGASARSIGSMRSGLPLMPCSARPRRWRSGCRRSWRC
jgi:hypothetical protein